MALAHSIGTPGYSDGNTSNAGLPDNLFIQTSTINITVTVTWSGNVADYESDRVRKIDIIPFYWIPVYEEGMGTRQQYIIPTADLTSGSHEFTITFTPASAVWAAYYGFYDGSISYQLLDAEDNIQGEGYTGSSFYYYGYAIPSIDTVTVERCNSDGSDNSSGTYGKATFSYDISSLGDQNTKECSIYIKDSTSSTWGDADPITISTYSGTITNHVLVGTFNSNASYDVKISVTDLLNTINSQKILQASYALVHFSADKTQIGFGKYCEEEGPGFDVNLTTRFRDDVQFDVAPTVPDATVRSAFISTVQPYCRLSAPTSESVTRNASYYFWVFDFQTESNPGSYEIITGGSGGTRKMGWVIPEDGLYRITKSVRFNSGSTASNIVLGIARLPSDWTPPTVNYRTEAGLISDATEFVEQHMSSWNSAISNGQLIHEMQCSEGEKIWATVFLVSASKTLVVENTWCSIQRIG